MTDLETIAERIASDLFTNGAREEADRLVLTSASGRDLGGWSRGPVRDRIIAALKGGPAETGALLAEVERLYDPAHFALDVRRNPDGSYQLRVFDRASLKRVAYGSGPTLAAALRDLLGVDGG